MHFLNILFLTASTILVTSCDGLSGPKASDSNLDSQSETVNCTTCPIQLNTTTEQINSNETTEEQSNLGSKVNVDIPIAKKMLNLELEGSANYEHAQKAIETVYQEMTGGDPDLAQRANLFRSVQCALIQIVCEDPTLSNQEKTALKTQFILAYGERVDKITSSPEVRDTRQKPVSRPAKDDNSKQPTTQSAAEITEKATNFNVDVKGDNYGPVIQGETINIQTITTGGKKKDDH